MRYTLRATSLRLLAIAMSTVLLTSAYYRIHSAAIMSEAANTFLNSLTPEQRSRATFQFADDERMNWHFIPKPRKGLPLKDMTAPQKHLAHALLSAGLSQRGYIKASSIMSLEDVLRIIEKDNGERRNPEGYFFSVFGEPSEKGTWGYRFEGHHVSQNFTVVNGRVVGSPSFFGTNPAEVKDGPRKGLRVLAHEEDLGRELIQGLSADQQKVAIVDKEAYKDIITMASRKAALEGKASGLQISKIARKQFRQDHHMPCILSSDLFEVCHVGNFGLQKCDRSGQIHFGLANRNGVNRAL